MMKPGEDRSRRGEGDETAWHGGKEDESKESNLVSSVIQLLQPCALSTPRNGVWQMPESESPVLRTQGFQRLSLLNLKQVRMYLQMLFLLLGFLLFSFLSSQFSGLHVSPILFQHELTCDVSSEPGFYW